MDTYDIDAIRGDTFPGVQFTVYVNGPVKNLTGAIIRMEIRKASKQGALVKSLSSVSGGITITNAVGGQFQIDPFKVEFDAGKYFYDIEIDISGTITTYIEGIFTSIQDVTV